MVDLGVGAFNSWCGESGSGSCKSLVRIWEWELHVLGVYLGVGAVGPLCSGSESGRC